MNKFRPLTFALAGGIVFGAVYFFGTLSAILGVPGFPPFGELLRQFYGPWGYSLSWWGTLMAALWGFVEGFCWVGLFGLVYNWLNKK